MSLIAKIDYLNLVSTYPDQNGGETDRGDIYISIIDTITNQPANGNNCKVTYRIDDNGSISQQEVIISGQSKMIYSGTFSDRRYNFLGEETYHFYIDFSVLELTPGTGDTDPVVGGCDLAITSIGITRPETATGANDGQITAHASSSYGGIQYSLDNVTFQQSPLFTGLNGGVKTVYVRDSNGCYAELSVLLPTLSSLLVSGPSATLPDGNISHWNAAFNPIVFTYQRKDFGIISATADTTTGYVTLQVNTVLNPITGKPTLLPGDKVYVNAAPYVGVYEVEKVAGNAYLIIRAPFAGNASGFININKMRAYYKVLTQIAYTDKQTGTAKTITSTNRPDNNGLVKADISNFAQSLLRAQDASNYALNTYWDDNLSASYQIAYAEAWDEDGVSKQSAFIPIGHNFHVLYAAKQLGERYGGNLAAYVPFANLASGLPAAKWISDFAEPAYSNGYPFDIGFIYTEEMEGLDVYCEYTLLDINRMPLPGGPQTGYLLTEDGGGILNADGSKLITTRQNSGIIPVNGQPGLNRLLLSGRFADEVYYINITLKYADNDGVHALTQTQTVRVDDAIDDNSVYLRWIGLSGSWNYYRFIFNQEISLDVQNAVIIKNYVTDWENQQGIEDVISKSAGQKMKVVAEDLSVADIKGLQSIKYSPKVQLLVNKNPVKWQTVVINTATYSEYETRNGQAPFSVTFNMPAINIQTQ
jgi:hypothetical protein